MSAEVPALEWSDWMNLEEVPDSPWGALADAGVVYQLRAVTGEGDPQPRGRFLATDLRGLLYIGRTTGRIGQRLKKLLQGRESGREMTHTVGRKLHVLDRLSAFRTTFSDLTIQFRYALCDDPRDREKKLLRAYTARFGETPPLNGEFPNRGDREAWREHLLPE